MSVIVTRAGKGTTLSWVEADANFTNLNNDKVEKSELASSTGSSMIGYLPDGTGAAKTTVQSKLRESVSVKDFGAVGDGITDDSNAFVLAIAAATASSPKQKSIFIPAGDYLIKSTINVNAAVEFIGEGAVTAGTRIFADSALNSPIFYVTSGARFFNLTLLGTYNPLNTNESCVHIQGANNVTFNNVSIFSSYVGVLFDGNTAIFYASFTECRFENTLSSFIKINNTSAAGVDLILTHCRFLGNMPNSCWIFEQGLGSIIASDIQISVTGDGPTDSLVYFGDPASAYGGSQFSNCVFESGGASANSHAFRMTGGVATPWKEMHFDTCLFTSSSGPSVLFGYTVGATFTNCTFSSSNTTGNVQFTQFRNVVGVNFIGCRWESLAAAPAVYGTNVNVQATFISPYWGGSTPFIDFSVGVTPVIDVLGGYVGTHATPILLPDFTNNRKNIQTQGVNYGPLQHKLYVGTLNNSGAANVTHGITNGHLKIIKMEAWYKGGSGEMQRMSANSVDGINIYLTGGGASAKYRLSVMYMVESDTNWS